jgi:hypothetical protein
MNIKADTYFKINRIISALETQYYTFNKYQTHLGRE